MIKVEIDFYLDSNKVMQNILISRNLEEMKDFFGFDNLRGIIKLVQFSNLFTMFLILDLKKFSSDNSYIRLE